MTRLAGSVITATTTITASAENPPNETATKLRDDDAATKWLAFTTNTTLTYQLPTPTAVTSYAFTSGNDSPNRDPRNWTLAGSNDGSSFTTIDTQTGIAAMSGRGVRASYTVPSGNVASYTYYRLNITAVNGDTITQLAEWDLAGIAVPPVYLDGWGLLDSAQGMLSSYAAAVLADAPVLYLRLGEASGSVAADSSAGTPVNGAYQSSPTLAQPGLLDADPSTAVKFTGSAQVLVTPTSKLNPPGTAYTVECWVQHLGTAAANQFAFRWLGSGGLCALGFNSNGSAEFTVMYSVANSFTLSSPLVNMRDGQPHHLVGVRDADNVYLYIDGTLAASGTRTTVNNSSSNSFQLGNDGSGTAFGGTLDEVAFYPSALSAARIAIHYAIGLGARAKPVWVADVASSGLVFTASMAATVATLAAGDLLVAVVQRSGGIVNSVSGCGATWTKAFGQSSGQANDFWIGAGATAAGAVTATLSAAVSGLLNVLTVRNLSSTAIRARHNEQGSVISPGTPTASGASDSSGAGCIVIAPQTVSSGFNLSLFAALAPALGWGNVGGGGNQLKWRVSLGTESVSTGLSSTNTGSVAYGIGQLVLGPGGSAPVSYDAEVLADSPLVYWKLDETSGTTMTDSSGNARNGTYSGATLAQAPLVNDAGKSALGGASGQGVGSLASAAWMEQASFSAECWVKPNNTNAGGRSVFSRFTSGNMNWALFQDTGALRFILNSTQAVGPTYTVGVTYHLVGTYDGTTLRLYVNGSLYASAATTQSGTSGQNMQVGGHAGANYSQATVDGVAFYGTVLSAARVAAHYVAGL